MDLLSKRYADPCFFLDGMIRTCRLDEFVDDILQITNKEKEDQVTWEFFLHRVFDKSFEDFVEEIKINKENKNMSKRTIETTVNHTMNILNKFNPEKGGE
jgi:hypothetical protein